MALNEICNIANCALAYRHPNSDTWLCYDCKNPASCPIAKKAYRLKLESENTEYDYGHNI